MVSIAEVLSDPALRLEVVDLPDPEREVRWVAVSELADPAPFLEGGEVLLTTGLETSGWDSQWRAYVDRLADVGVAAIGLAIGLTHDRVPEPLEAACRAREVNLFQVPKQTTFVAVSRNIADRLEAAERAATREALEVQRRLIQAALRDDTIAVLARLAEAAGGAACTILADGRCEEGPVGPLAERIDVKAAAEEVARIRPLGLRAASSAAVTGGTMLVQPVGLAARPSRYVVAIFPGRVSEQQRLAMTTAVALLGLSDERRRAGRDTDRALRSRALELLLRGETRGATLLLDARPGQPPLRLPQRAIVIRAAGAVDVLADALAEVEEHETEVLSALLGEELVCVARSRDVQRLTTALAARGARVGIGEQVPLAQLERSHATAGFALTTTGDANPLASWETAVGGGVASLIDPPRAAAFAESLLSRLRGPGEKELLATLASFLRHHGSHARVATELGLHRNTVRNRLMAIEKALDRSLDDPQTRVDCWVALQASRLSESHATP